MLEKQIVISQCEVTECNVIQVRTSIKILENGIKLSETYQRHCIAPGQDYSQEDTKVQAICALVHTPEAILTYQTMLTTN